MSRNHDHSKLGHVPGDQPSETNETSDAAQDIAPAVVWEKFGLSSADMAKLVGMSEFGYRSWEMGSRRPGGPALKLLVLIGAQPKKVPRWLNTLYATR